MLDPILIDTAKFTQEGLSHSGETTLAQLDARVFTHELLADTGDTVHYRIRGGTDRWQRPFLDIALSGVLQLVCQRCLKPVPFVLEDHAHVVLFADEARLDEAMAADETLEGMLYSAEIDLRTLLEDQLLMAIPFAPRHEDCNNATLARVNQDQPIPFAKLAGLKSDR